MRGRLAATEGKSKTTESCKPECQAQRACLRLRLDQDKSQLPLTPPHPGKQTPSHKHGHQLPRVGWAGVWRDNPCGLDKQKRTQDEGGAGTLRKTPYHSSPHSKHLLLSHYVVSDCSPMDCSTTGSSALRYLPEFTQIHPKHKKRLYHWWHSGKEFSCQCRGHRFDPCAGISHMPQSN